MPFMRDGKCVYKKNKDGSRGKKEGCSDSVEKAKDYLKALYANVDDATKKENKTMKIKKSELLALIKEEIMSEMYSDDPRMDDVYPEVGEAQKIVEMIMDMSGGDKVAAMEMLKNAMGMLQSEIDAAAEPMMQEARLQEGVGMPEIMAFVNAVIKFASDPVTAPLVAAVVAGTPLMLAFEQYSEMKKKKEGDK
jgi:hypothetical protein